MLTGPLPQVVNIRKAVTRGARYDGVLGAEQLPQFSAILESRSHPIEASVQFGEDEEGRQFAAVTMMARVQLECQRCLKPISTELRGVSSLGLVAGDDQARALPARYEPWIAIDEVDLWEMVAEELALALPVVAYHPEGECRPPGPEVVGPEDEDEKIKLGDEVDSDNPFKVLSALLDGDDAKEK